MLLFYSNTVFSLHVPKSEQWKHFGMTVTFHWDLRQALTDVYNTHKA